LKDGSELAEVMTVMMTKYTNQLYSQLEMRLYWEFPWIARVPWESHGNGNR